MSEKLPRLIIILIYLPYGKPEYKNLMHQKWLMLIQKYLLDYNLKMTYCLLQFLQATRKQYKLRIQ